MCLFANNCDSCRIIMIFMDFSQFSLFLVLADKTFVVSADNTSDVSADKTSVVVVFFFHRQRIETLCNRCKRDSIPGDSIPTS